MTSDMVGHVFQRRMCLEFAGGDEGRSRKKLGRRQQLVQDQREELEEEYLQKAVRLAVQGRWTNWKDFNQSVITWRSLVYGEAKLYRFCVGATFNTLASPVNLKRLVLSLSDECYLCKKKCTLQHVLSGCKVALSQGRYR